MIDEIRDMAYITGKPDPGKNNEDLVANARGIIKDVRYKPPVPPSRAWIWWTGGGIVVLLAFAGIFIYRRRSARGAK